MIDPPPELRKTWQPCNTHPVDEVLVLRVDPLRLTAISTSLEFAANIVGPCDTILVDRDRVPLIGQLKDIIEEGVGNSTTRTSDCCGIERGSSPAGRHFHVCVGNVRRADAGFDRSDSMPEKLLIAFGGDIPAMILVKIIEFIEQVHRRLHVLLDSKANHTGLTWFTVLIASSRVEHLHISDFGDDHEHVDGEYQ